MNAKVYGTSLECPTQLKREAKNTNSPRKRDQGEAPSPPRFSGEKPLYTARREDKGRPEFQETTTRRE